ncbi:hypothetical protein HQ602_17310 [Rhodococcus kroppenstedtii]|uniref:DUF6278 family protein n=1 Tax=Rhodococcoides kroppenstedtii TaxID=293050 RepID=UPI001C9B21D2|nr:DUF6278 family protein [Rhodococcus kroppenstedtii]MBY6438135.1 hypothetical protein [Rhodococcus kroppenstedtii]
MNSGVGGRWSLRVDELVSPSLTARLPGAVQRALRVGPRYGVARGMALYGPAPRDHVNASWSILQPEKLSRWLGDRGERCDASMDTLVTVERLLPLALEDDDLGPMSAVEVALLLGQVLVSTAPDARWAVWPNGHPVVRVGHSDVDVVQLSDAFVHDQGESVSAIAARYQHGV